MHRKVAKFATSERACASEKRGPMTTFERHVDVDWKGSVMEGKGEAREGSGRALSRVERLPRDDADYRRRESGIALLPKEHGAYGQLLFPLITAMAVGRPGVAAWSFAAAAVCAFLAHEPLLLLLGQRGPCARRERQDDAVRWFAAF